MTCSLCRYWLRDTRFPGGVGYCYPKGAVVKASDACELFKKREGNGRGQSYLVLT